MTDDLGKYLGVPILHKRVSRSTFNFVNDKVNQRLSSWKARNLSFGGHITLAKYVIQALPSRVMQTSMLPKSVCDEMDKLCRGLFGEILVWGGKLT